MISIADPHITAYTRSCQYLVLQGWITRQGLGDLPGQGPCLPPEQLA